MTRCYHFFIKVEEEVDDGGKVSEVDIMFLFCLELNFPAKKATKTNLIFGYWKTNNWGKKNLVVD